MARRAHRRREALDKRGATALEYGLLAPVLFALLLGIMDMGRLMWMYTGLNRGVTEAARCGAVDSTNCGTTAQIQNVAAAGVWGATVPSSTFSVSTSAACGVQVTASYTFQLTIPGFSSIVLAPSACFTKLY